MRLRGLILGMLAACAGAADAQAARIGPGSLLPEVACTANFVFRDATSLYLGTAGHCVFGPAPVYGGNAECGFASLPLGSPIIVEGASKPAILEYSSFETMNRLGEPDEAACADNDFALLRIDPADHASVDPSMPVWGGPVGLRRAPYVADETLMSFGRSIHRRDVEPLKPREGYFGGWYRPGWLYGVWLLTPAIFGDSGSAVIDGAGGAAGVVSNLGGANGTGIADLAAALDYMRSHGGPDARLVTGTAPFTGATIPERAASPPSQPEPLPPAEPAPAPAPAPAVAPTPPASPASTAPPPKAKPKPKAKRKRARRCRTRGANRRAVRGRKAPKCSRRKATRRRR